MYVKIKIKGNNETNEQKDALALKKIFEFEFRNGQVNGEILIICNATLFGQEIKDIDLIAIGKFEKYSQRIETKHESYKPRTNDNPPDQEKRETVIIHHQEMRKVFINSFCFVFETKRHRTTDIRLDGLTLSVKYNNKYSDVTTQSEKKNIHLRVFSKTVLIFHPTLITSYG